jgi:hypothetical protein
MSERPKSEQDIMVEGEEEPASCFSRCCNLMCLFGCLTLFGLRDRVTRKLVYFPPARATYAFVENAAPVADTSDKHDSVDGKATSSSKASTDSTVSVASGEGEDKREAQAHTWHLVHRVTGRAILPLHDNRVTCAFVKTRAKNRVAVVHIRYPRATATGRSVYCAEQCSVCSVYP